MRRSLAPFFLLILAIGALIAATTPFLLAHTRIGLEFQGGYEILYKAAAPGPGQVVSHDALLKTARLLEKQANALGVAEPDVRIEGTNQIRVKLAGVSTNDQVRTLMPADLPLQLTEKYSQTVGGVLGAADLTDTLRAGAIALALIITFLVVVYRVPGVIASFALIVSLWLLFGLFYLVHGTLSIAAIVAFVLGLGILSDANILSFERIREEIRSRRGLVSALTEGYRRSLRTILDSNLSVLLAAAILFIAGIGPVRGFALTVGLSICVSILCNVFLTHLLLYLLADESRLESRWFFSPTLRRQAATPGRFNVVRYGPTFLAASGLIAILGGASLVRGNLNYDIDFKAGTALDVTVPRAMTQDEATSVMVTAGIKPATVAVGGKDLNQVAARFDNVLNGEQVNTIIAGFKSAYGTEVAYQENTADPAVARSLATQAIYAMAFAVVGLFLFVALRFGWRFAVSTTCALLNSTFFVLSMFSVFHLEIDVTFIAAILTVMGYSINDTVVIFDRIRENMKKGLDQFGDLRELVNVSVRQTLRRAVFTVLTVITGSVCLYAFGAEPLQIFSLAIFLGLVCATYSSLFIALPIWLSLSQGHLRADRTLVAG